MDREEIKETDIWELYNKSVMFANKNGFYTNVDRDNRMYNGDQWDGLVVEGVEKVQLNFIKPIINYKSNKVTSSLRAINYSADNVESSEFRIKAKKICDLLNQRASRVWNKQEMDLKLKKIAKKSCVTGESILYNSYDEETNNPNVEILSMVDVYYGNENEPDIQKQPYILVKQRMSLLEAKEVARNYNVSENDIKNIVGDEENLEEAGESAKDELDRMCTIITKFYRDKGTIWFAKSTRWVDIKGNTEMGTTLYPLTHMSWEEVEGSARGIGEVRYLIGTQIEVNKTAMRRLITSKNIAYPQKVYNSDIIQNPDAIGTVGGMIEVKGQNVDDVRKAITTTTPMSMSNDVKEIQNELIDISRELANASDAATGQINPDSASGRAILAVQQASEQPLDDQNTELNVVCKDLARIWLDMWKTYNVDGMEFEDIETDPMTGEEILNLIPIDGDALERVQASVKIDVTPRGAYDKYAQELSIENLAKTDLFMNTNWLEDYVSLLESDAVMPKLKLEELIKKRKETQQRIREINQQAMGMQQQIAQLMSNGTIIPQGTKDFVNSLPENDIQTAG